ncbi:nucleoside recognition protein [Ottowia sp. GY511]|uniref:Nucleoside recognition domain-containing protein n=1 Tax=Ottowia flava TaxID=2675430 RepID=A0ABW4KUW0_9BURK|nr:nucleoside recognition domain-containing protein [Ottowia sp. GY511]TXK26879.1 nucleoside recognition protein [Ottowia sp. GY511]
MRYLCQRMKATWGIYWELVRIIVPVALVTEVLMITGVVSALAPLLAPLMAWYGLPPELALGLLVGWLVGVWSAAMVLFVLVPPSALSIADVTVFSALLLFAHALPIEQQIIRRAGPPLLLTTALRVGGGLIYAAGLHALLNTTGWLAEPVAPRWQPAPESVGWGGFFLGLGETLLMMFVILATLMCLLDLAKASGLMAGLQRAMGPLLRLAGIRGDAVHLTAVGLFLGISYGGGLLIREAREGHIAKRQVLLSCIFMGFAHSLIEDTLIVVSLGADVTSVLLGRLLFAVAATAIVGVVLAQIPERSS